MEHANYMVQNQGTERHSCPVERTPRRAARVRITAAVAEHVGMRHDRELAWRWRFVQLRFIGSPMCLSLNSQKPNRLFKLCRDRWPLVRHQSALLPQPFPRLKHLKLLHKLGQG
jgi:hypothetical protein